MYLLGPGIQESLHKIISVVDEHFALHHDGREIA